MRSARKPARRSPALHTPSPPGPVSMPGHLPKHTGLFSAWEAWPPRTPASERLQHHPGLRWPSTHTRSSSSRAVSPPFRCPGAPHPPQPAPASGPCMGLLPARSAPPALWARGPVWLRPGQCRTGGRGLQGWTTGPDVSSLP